MLIVNRTYINQINSAADKLGIALPKPYADAVKRTQALTIAAESYGEPAAAIANRAVTVLLEGKDPAADAEVQELMRRRTIVDAGLLPVARDRAGQIISDALVTSADDILSSWNVGLADDFETLSEAAGSLSMPNLAAADTDLLRRSGTLEMWASAYAANGRVEIAQSAFRAIIQALQVQAQREHDPLALTDAANANAVNALSRSEGHDVDAWTVARTGGQLSLATITAYMERIAAYTAAAQARQRRVDDALNEAGFEGRAKARAEAEAALLP